MRKNRINILTILLLWLMISLCALIMSCVQSEAPTGIWIPWDTIVVPANIKISNSRVTKYTDSITADTVSLASFLVTWNSVPKSLYYRVYIADTLASYYDTFTVIDTNNRLFLDSLLPQRSYMVRLQAAKVRNIPDTINPGVVISDTLISELSEPVYANVILPEPSKNIWVEYGKRKLEQSDSAFVNILWDASVSEVTGYTIFIRNAFDSVMYVKKSAGGTVLSANEYLHKNKAFKINIKSESDIGISETDSIYGYDLTLSINDGYKLPYVYFSTYSKPLEYSLQLDTIMVITNDTIKKIISLDMAGVRGGIFSMGDIWEKGNTNISSPIHEVELSSFLISRTEITNAQYSAFLNSLDTSLIEYIDTSISMNSVIYKDSIIYDSLKIYYDSIVKIDTLIVSLEASVYDTVFDTTFITLKKKTVLYDTITVPLKDTIVIIKALSRVVYNNQTYLSLSPYLTTDTLGNRSCENFYYIKSDSFSVISGKEDFPITGVHWVGATAFCNWLTTETGYTSCYKDKENWSFDSTGTGYRLPTEAEFEYVQSLAYLNIDSRGTKQRYPWGATHDQLRYGSSLMGLGATNRFTYFGINDMTGNVKEWCHDFSDNASTTSPYYNTCLNYGIVFDPTGPATGSTHIIRGGSYQLGAKENVSSWRYVGAVTDFSDIGFRIVRKSR